MIAAPDPAAHTQFHPTAGRLNCSCPGVQMTTLDGRGDDRRTTLERLGPAALRVSLYWRVFAVNAAILSAAVALLIVDRNAPGTRPRGDKAEKTSLIGNGCLELFFRRRRRKHLDFCERNLI